MFYFSYVNALSVNILKNTFFIESFHILIKKSTPLKLSVPISRKSLSKRIIYTNPKLILCEIKSRSRERNGQITSNIRVSKQFWIDAKLWENNKFSLHNFRNSNQFPGCLKHHKNSLLARAYIHGLFFVCISKIL